MEIADVTDKKKLFKSCVTERAGVPSRKKNLVFMQLSFLMKINEGEKLTRPYQHQHLLSISISQTFSPETKAAL